MNKRKTKLIQRQFGELYELAIESSLLQKNQKRNTVSNDYTKSSILARNLRGRIES